MTTRPIRWTALAAVGFLAVAGPARGQEPRAAGSPAKVKVVAGARYRAGALHRFLFGSGYRKLWTMPIEVEVLDMASFSGGLKAKKKGGAKQTKSVHLDGADGREWRFRSIDKDPSATLQPVLRKSPVDDIVQDQISASHPGNAPVVDALTDAAGILHVNRLLVVLPDDEGLGEFRQEFAGMLGTLQEKPSVKPPVTPGFEGFTRLLDTDELWKALAADPREQVDARAFLEARLFDALIGDFDRHVEQWDWAKSAASGLWVPVPKDRDLAFVNFDGLVLGLARINVPRLVKFGDSYPSMVGLMWQGRFLDRRHLASLEWSAWPPVVSDLQRRLPDRVIDEAVARMLPPYYHASGATLAARLKRRRDALPGAARRFYEILAKEAEVYATDEPDAAELLRHRDGSVDVSLGADSAGGAYFTRRYDPRDTDEVRVFLEGGDDRATSRGEGGSGVKVRLVGGDGDDVLDDREGGHTRAYDSSDRNQVLEGPGTHESDRPYDPPLDFRGDPPRDWGHDTTLMPWLRIGGGVGVLLGAQVRGTTYGFRKHPSAHRHAFRLGYSILRSAGQAEYEYESLRTDNQSRFHVLARASQLDLIRFHGFGNETPAPRADSFYDVKQRQYSLAPSYRFNITSVDISVGPVVKYATTRLPPDTMIGQERPYGVGRFGQVGARLGFTADGRDFPDSATRGALLAVEGSYYPRAWSVKDQFGEVHGEAAVYATAPIPVVGPTLALRAAGQKVWGRYPFHEAAYIGGPDTVRGLRRERYAGDASAFGNAELRFGLVGGRYREPARFGIFALTDAGRVFLQGESSHRWHTAYGGGLWLALGKPENTVTAGVGRSEGRVRVYATGGFTF